MKANELIGLIAFLLMITIVTTVVLSYENKDGKYCEKHGGKWSRGICFNNKFLIEMGN